MIVSIENNNCQHFTDFTNKECFSSFEKWEQTKHGQYMSIHTEVKVIEKKTAI